MPWCELSDARGVQNQGSFTFDFQRRDSEEYGFVTNILSRKAYL